MAARSGGEGGKGWFGVCVCVGGGKQMCMCVHAQEYLLLTSGTVSTHTSGAASTHNAHSDRSARVSGVVTTPSTHGMHWPATHRAQWYRVLAHRLGTNALTSISFCLFSCQWITDNLLTLKIYMFFLLFLLNNVQILFCLTCLLLTGINHYYFSVVFNM